MGQVGAGFAGLGLEARSLQTLPPAVGGFSSGQERKG